MAKGISLKSNVYHSILDGIFKDEYKPNQILNEQELVNRFGCSKSPVREALIALCNEGVLLNIPRYGYEVIRLTHENVKEILHYRQILECGFLKICYQDITESQLKQLAYLDDLCNAASEDLWTHWDRNKTFHIELLSISKNEYAKQQLDKSMDILKRAYAQFYWGKWDAAVVPPDTQSHLHLIECLREKDINKSLYFLEEDFNNFIS